MLTADFGSNTYHYYKVDDLVTTGGQLYVYTAVSYGASPVLEVLPQGTEVFLCPRAPTSTITATASPTKTTTGSVSATATASKSSTHSPTVSVSPTATGSFTPTPTVTPTATKSKTVTATATPTPTTTPSGTGVISPTATSIHGACCNVSHSSPDGYLGYGNGRIWVGTGGGYWGTGTCNCQNLQVGEQVEIMAGPNGTKKVANSSTGSTIFTVTEVNCDGKPCLDGTAWCTPWIAVSPPFSGSVGGGWIICPVKPAATPTGTGPYGISPTVTPTASITATAATPACGYYNTWYGIDCETGNSVYFCDGAYGYVWLYYGSYYVYKLQDGRCIHSVRRAYQTLSGLPKLQNTQLYYYCYNAGCAEKCPTYPRLLYPVVTSMNPRYSTGDVTVTRGFQRYYGTYQYNQYAIWYSIIPDQTSIVMNLSVNAYDPNPALKNTGGLEYHWWMPGMADWQAGGASQSFTFNHGTNSYVYCRIAYKNYGNGKAGRICPETKYTYCIFYINYPSCRPPTASYGCPDWWQRRNGVNCTAATVTYPGCTDNYPLIYQFYKNPNTYPGASMMSRYRNIGYTNEVEIQGTYNSATIQYSGNYWYQPDKLIIYKDLYGENNGEQIKVIFKGACGNTTLSTTFVNSTPTISVVNYYGTTALFWKYSRCYYNWWTRQTTYSYYYSPTSWYGYFYLTNAWYNPCAYYRILKDGVPQTGYLKLTYGRIYYSGCGFQFYGNSLRVYANRSCFPNDSHTITLEIYSGVRNKGNIGSGSKSSTTWNVVFKNSPTYNSPYGRINLSYPYYGGCGGWYPRPCYYWYWNCWYYNYYYYNWYYYQRYYLPAYTYQRINLRTGHYY